MLDNQSAKIMSKIPYHCRINLDNQRAEHGAIFLNYICTKTSVDEKDSENENVGKCGGQWKKNLAPTSSYNIK